MTTSVVLTDLFQKSYDDLDGSLKGRVMDFIMKLQRDPDATGLDLKIPQAVRDRRVRTARVTDNFRAVLFELPDRRGYLMAAVKPHDAAYDYASRAEVGVNEATGALEILDRAALAAVVGEAVAATAAVPEARPVLAAVGVKDLCRLGIAPEVADQLVRISDQDRLYEVADHLPHVQGVAVLDLAAGRSVEEVWADLAEAEATPDADTNDLAAALDRPLSRLSFTSPQSEADLRAVLEDSFERWRVFLHPLQRALAYRDGYRGPFRVTGAAGTGKTVVAVHRAAHLAARLAEGAGPEERVLFTTYTTTLVQDIRERLVRLAGPKVLDRVEVLTVDALAHRVLAASGSERQPRPELHGDTDQAVLDLWNYASRGSPAWSDRFLASEWSQVVLAQDITDRASYLTASRAGRGRRLSRVDRAALWEIFERFKLQMAAHNYMTFTQVAAEAAAAPLDARLSFRHVVVDEAQDLHPAHWRLLRRLVPPGPDDIFLVGDAHQRIYANQVSLSRLGIETRGRSRRLTVNYRTSQEILRCGLAVLGGERFDDLDGEADQLAGYRSEFHGPTPELARFYDRSAELDAVAETVRGWHADGIELRDICVVARTPQLRNQVMEALSSSGLDRLQLEQDTSPQDERDGVRVATMHRVKGLEFRAMAVVGLDKGTVPLAWLLPDDDPVEGAQVLQRERSLVYVACSRARDRLALSWTGTPSRFITPLAAMAGKP